METIGERLELVRQNFRFSKKEMSEYLKILPQNYSRYIQGEASLKTEILILIRDKSINIDWLLTGEGEMFLPSETEKKALGYPKRPPGEIPIFDGSETSGKAFFVPLLDQKLSAGTGADLPDEDYASIHIPAPVYLKKYGANLAALTVQGDSMEPTLHEGDVIVCDSCGWAGVEGVYAVRMNGHGYVKRILQHPDKIIVKSDNPTYSAFELPPEIEDSGAFSVIGRVHCVIKRLTLA